MVKEVGKKVDGLLLLCGHLIDHVCEVGEKPTKKHPESSTFLGLCFSRW